MLYFGLYHIHVVAVLTLILLSSFFLNLEKNSKEALC